MTKQFDLFGSDAARPEKATRPSKLPPKAGRAVEEEDMVALLEATGRYRVLRKLEARAVASKPRPEFPLRGVILDTETTGLNARKDEIIEIGAVVFSFDERGRIGDVVATFNALRQPSVAIPEQVTRLTGITMEMVEGQSIDIQTLVDLIRPVDIVIAHNAGFDRPFCEAFHSVFSEKAWACSVSEIDWGARGFEGTKLGYLIGQSGYFHNGHRALDDCFALLDVLSTGKDDESSLPFSELYFASQRARVRIFAENSPFDMKDHLKARGYRWSDGSDGRPKAWWIETDEATYHEELQYLRRDIYRWEDADPPVRHLTAFDRYKA